MIIIGVDPGLAATGYGLIQCRGNRYAHIAHGVIRTDSGMPTGQRLLLLQDTLRDIVREHRPEVAGVETLYFGKNARSAFPVAQARGVVLCTLAAEDVSCFEYSPRTIKQSVVGHGTAEKHQIQEMIRIILRLEKMPRDDHAADALAVAFCHSTHGALHRVSGDPPHAQ